MQMPPGHKRMDEEMERQMCDSHNSVSLCVVAYSSLVADPPTTPEPHIPVEEDCFSLSGPVSKVPGKCCDWLALYGRCCWCPAPTPLLGTHSFPVDPTSFLPTGCDSWPGLSLATRVSSASGWKCWEVNLG